jgi:DNA invertase Pin-like site-specific DNA recombinase
MSNHTHERRSKILTMRADGKTYRAIADEIGLSVTRIRRIILFDDPTKLSPSKIRRMGLKIGQQ